MFFKENLNVTFFLLLHYMILGILPSQIFAVLDLEEKKLTKTSGGIGLNGRYN